MRGGRALGLVAITAAVGLSDGADPAKASFVLDASGQPYTGQLIAGVAGNVVFSSSAGDVTCNTSTPTGQITTAGSPGIGFIHDIDWKNNTAPNACPDTIPMAVHQDFVAQGLDWPLTIDWLSDSTSGTLNGTLTFSGVRFLADFDVVDCTYVGNFNGTAGTSRQIQGDLHNPDNTSSGDLELRLTNEPLSLLTGDFGCESSGTLTATYHVFGAGLIDLQVRQNPPPAPPPVVNQLVPTPTTPTQPIVVKKCKKKRSAAAARKRCRKKR